MKSEIVLHPGIELLKDRLRIAAQSLPVYRNIEISGIDACSKPEDLLSLFPVQEKEQLIELGDAYFEIEKHLIALFSETSGTTGGKPLLTPRSMYELTWNSRNISIAFERFLSRVSDRVAILNPGIMSPFSEACGLALQQLSVPYLRVFPIRNTCEYPRIFKILESYGITSIMTTPSLAYKLLFERDRLNIENFPVKTFLLTGELISDGCLNNINRMLKGNGKAFPFVYGSSEAATCFWGTKEGSYEPIIKDFTFELVPKYRSSVWKDKSVYELLITWMNSGIRPLVRYNTRDLFIIDEEASSGREIKLKSIGRESDGIGADILYKTDEIIYNSPVSVYYYEITLFENNSAEVTVIVNPSEKYTGDLEFYLTKNLSSFFSEVSVVVNPDHHLFYNFEPFIKTKRITRKYAEVI
jgi:phenylacetate-coenzyme A ligase PaaK-like adenylate-forming protein